MHIKATEIVTLDLLFLIQHLHAEHDILLNTALKKLLEKEPQVVRGGLRR